jgi:redox-sensing transcriptional repressor
VSCGPPDFENECTSAGILGSRPGIGPGSRRQEASTVSSARRIPEATVVRLPLYYRALLETADQHVGTVSSERLAELAGVNAAKVRKDLSYLGSYGTRGVGYDVEFLLHQISRELGLTHDWPVVIVGVGNLGHALANYRGFGARGFQIVGLVDADEAKVGSRVGSLRVDGLDDLPRIVADRLVDAGVNSILNFAPAVVTVPSGVSLRKVDLAIELQILSFYQQRKVPAGDGQRSAAPRAAGSVR